MQKVLGFVALVVLGACGGGDAAKPEVVTRDATTEECAAGGTVLVVDGQEMATVCDGADGRDGTNGRDDAQGAQGPQGARGLDGALGAPGAAGSDAPDPSQIVAGIVAKAASIVIVECSDGVTSADGSGTKTNTGTVIRQACRGWHDELQRLLAGAGHAARYDDADHAEGRSR